MDKTIKLGAQVGDNVFGCHIATTSSTCASDFGRLDWNGLPSVSWLWRPPLTIYIKLVVRDADAGWTAVGAWDVAWWKTWSQWDVAGQPHEDPSSRQSRQDSYVPLRESC